MNKKWKPIPGYSKYLISNYGEIYSTLTNRLLRPFANQDGYLRVQLKNDNNIHKWNLYIN